MTASPPAGRRPTPTLTLPRPRRSPVAVAAAVVLHAGLFGLLLWARARDLLTWQPGLDPGVVATSRGGGGGGGRLIEVAVPAWRPSAPPRAAVPAPPPVPARVVQRVSPPEQALQPAVEVAPAPDAQAATAPGEGGAGAGPGSGGGTGGGHGTGSGLGTGPGTGPGSGGEGGRAMAPEPRQLILPPLDYPRQMRGRTIAVTFWVNTSGRVERIALDPEIDDRGFAKKFEDVMRNYRFRPARSADGSPIPGTTTVSVTF